MNNVFLYLSKIITVTRKLYSRTVASDMSSIVLNLIFEYRKATYVVKGTTFPSWVHGAVTAEITCLPVIGID